MSPAAQAWSPRTQYLFLPHLFSTMASINHNSSKKNYELPLLKIDGSNYNTCKCHQMMVLWLCGLLKVVLGTNKLPEPISVDDAKDLSLITTHADAVAKWSMWDKDAFAQVTLNMDNGAMIDMMETTSAHEAWTWVIKCWEGKGMQLLSFLNQQLTNTRIKEEDNITEGLNNLHLIVSKMKTLGELISDAMLAQVMINVLPPTYTIVNTIIQTSNQHTTIPPDIVFKAAIAEEGAIGKELASPPCSLSPWNATPLHCLSTPVANQRERRIPQRVLLASIVPDLVTRSRSAGAGVVDPKSKVHTSSAGLQNRQRRRPRAPRQSLSLQRLPLLVKAQVALVLYMHFWTNGHAHLIASISSSIKVHPSIWHPINTGSPPIRRSWLQSRSKWAMAMKSSLLDWVIFLSHCKINTVMSTRQFSSWCSTYLIYTPVSCLSHSWPKAEPTCYSESHLVLYLLRTKDVGWRLALLMSWAGYSSWMPGSHKPRRASR